MLLNDEAEPFGTWGTRANWLRCLGEVTLSIVFRQECVGGRCAQLAGR